jgi:hypothetical protein
MNWRDQASLSLRFGSERKAGFGHVAVDSEVIQIRLAMAALDEQLCDAELLETDAQPIARVPSQYSRRRK